MLHLSRFLPRLHPPFFLYTETSHSLEDFYYRTQEKQSQKKKKKGVNALGGSTACGLKVVPLTKGV